MTRLGLILMLALGVACGDDDGRTVDGGPTTSDSGPVTFDTGPADSGIVLVDSGPGETDAGTDAGPVGTDAGTCTPRPITAIPAAMLPRCEAGTLQCLIDCGADGACQAGCFMADATPPAGDITCQVCISAQQISCGIANGCDTDYAAVDCCIQANACENQACIDTNCGGEQTTLQACLQGVGATCMPALQMCFAS